MKHFYHHKKGHWATLIDPTQEQIDAYPKGTKEIEPKPSAFHSYDGAKWVEDTAAKQAAEWERIRSQRDQKLSDTDWAVLPDSPHDTQAVREYRQALRDLPQSFGNPDKVKWPTNPLEE